MRGVLIETFKILNNFTNYGHKWFVLSERTGKLIVKQGQRHKMYFFYNRVIKYWNALPPHVRLSNSINVFKNRLDNFRQLHFDNLTSGQYWELSYQVFERC